MATGRAGDRGFWLILGAVLVAAVLVAVLVAIPGSRPEPAGTVLPDNPLARIVGDFQGMLAPGSESLPVVLAKLALAALLGGIIGYRQRPRVEDNIVQTFVIIAFTGALMMIIIGNQIVVAVGLLGAGSIVRYRTPVSDPRALAALFVTLGVGLAVGLGLYELALIAAVALVCLQGLASTIAGRLPPSLYSPRRGYILKLTTQDGVDTIAWLKEAFAARGIRARLWEYDARGDKSDLIKLTMSVEAAASMTTEQLTFLVLGGGVQSVSLEEKEA
jgi:uncharacterized membrane protein YhiD involved in acid resistance